MGDEAFKKICSGVENIIGGDELCEKLRAGKCLKVKLGVDPTRPDLTFGHMVVFNKLRQFQDLGHEAILLIGDYTTIIGDPSGRSETRPVLSKEQIEYNSCTYLDQAFKVLDPGKTTVRRNSEWFGEMSFEDALNLARRMTVARMLERDDFSKRYAEGVPISIVEFLYPLLQGQDSVELCADVELGGSDQLFNLLVGRALQKDVGQSEQCVITMPLLVGLDGKRKMSKSYNNYISFNDSPKDMFGKIMSIPDETMYLYYKYLLWWADDEISKLRVMHPMECKEQLAYTLTAKFFGSDVADHELKQFENIFSKNDLPDDIEEIIVPDFCETLFEALFSSGKFASKKELHRLIDQGGVKLEGTKLVDAREKFGRKEEWTVVQAGKRLFFKIR
ncbi:MAG: tyrosine--tRNA ligase [Puniceicoccales bacterium]|jgi:tyrosyl-tRNA synthetase|nr:tyrosine--tRNA ligase [Puniceicoccales bacterium]